MLYKSKEYRRDEIGLIIGDARDMNPTIIYNLGTYKINMHLDDLYLFFQLDKNLIFN